MRKIFLLLLFSIVTVLNSCSPTPTPLVQRQTPPPVTRSDDPNKYDVIYPAHTLTGRDGNTIVGYIYEINGHTFILNVKGGIEWTNYKL